jgi:aspartate ammonia-lyase
MKAHAVNLEKIVSDLRLLASGLNNKQDLSLPEKQVGSSIMPGKVNPVIAEFIISSAHRIYANDQLITTLSAQGCLDLNAYLPGIGCAMLESLRTMTQMNHSLNEHLLDGLIVHEEVAREKLFTSPAVTTALSPLIGYNQAARLAKEMKRTGKDIFSANEDLSVMDPVRLARLMEPENLLKKGFTMSDIRELL